MPASIFSFPIDGFVHAFFSFLSGWVADGAAALLAGLGAVVARSGGTDLNGLTTLEPSVLAIGMAMCVPLFLLALIQGVLRQDAGFVLRVAFLRLPAAAVLSEGAVVLVRLLLAATDEMSAAILAAAGVSEHRVLVDVGAALLISTPTGVSGFELLVLASVTAAVSLLLFIELAVRSAAIEVATLLCPLALAGLVWPATSHWARRLGEMLLALVFAKVVIAGTLALAATTLAAPGGLAAVVQGIALLTLASAAPFALLRLVPIVEAGAIGHLEGLGQRARRSPAAAYGRARALAGSSPPQPWSALALIGESAGAGAGQRPASGGFSPGGAGGWPFGPSGGPLAPAGSPPGGHGGRPGGQGGRPVGSWLGGPPGSVTQSGPAPRGVVQPLAPGGALWPGPDRDPFAAGSPLDLAAREERASWPSVGEDTPPAAAPPAAPPAAPSAAPSASMPPRRDGSNERPARRP